MLMRLDRKIPLPLKDQLKRQLLGLIRSGDLGQGQALPSAKDMAALLGVNRNTVAAVYRDLAAEGVLETVVGSGTFVRKAGPAADKTPLEQVLEDAIERAQSLGYGADEIADGFLTLLATAGRGRRGQVLVVECQHETADAIARALVDEFGVDVETVLIQDLEASPDRAPPRIAGKDLVVCGVNHVREVWAVAPDCDTEVVGVVLVSEVRLANEIAQLPKGTRVGVTCVNDRAAASLSKTVRIGQGATLTKIWAGADDPAGLKSLLENCDVVFASEFAYDRARALASPSQRVIRVEVGVTSASLDLVRERLEEAKKRPQQG